MNLALFLFLALCSIVGCLGVNGGRGHKGFSKSVVIETREGDVVDCVDIHEQASLSHPSLKNHVVQMKPSWAQLDDADNMAPTPRYGLTKPCPGNTVPVPRARVNLEQKLDTSNQHRVNAVYDDKDMKYGAGAEMNVYNLTLAKDQFSSHNIWVQANIGGHLSMILAGWRVDPQLFGDSVSRLFTYWTGDNFRNGCYNMLCKGFVQSDQSIYLGMPLYPTSTYGGLEFGIRLDIMQDRPTGNWWLIFEGNKPIGYWPKELFKTLGGGATLLAWGGVGKSGKGGICPPLGTGHFPDDSHIDPLMTHIEFVNSNKETVSANDIDLRLGVDKSGCYGLQQMSRVRDDAGALHYILFLGGPGGCHCGA